MKETEKVIEISYYDIEVGPGCILMYKGNPVVDVKELPGGRSEMRFCDKNEIPLAGSPKIIRGRPIIE